MFEFIIRDRRSGSTFISFSEKNTYKLNLTFGRIDPNECLFTVGTGTQACIIELRVLAVVDRAGPFFPRSRVTIGENRPISVRCESQLVSARNKIKLYLYGQLVASFIVSKKPEEDIIKFSLQFITEITLPSYRLIIRDSLIAASAFSF